MFWMNERAKKGVFRALLRELFGEIKLSHFYFTHRTLQFAQLLYTHKRERKKIGIYIKNYLFIVYEGCAYWYLNRVVSWKIYFAFMKLLSTFFLSRSSSSSKKSQGWGLENFVKNLNSCDSLMNFTYSCLQWCKYTREMKNLGHHPSVTKSFISSYKRPHTHKKW
jgi:hypothetical protein